MTSSAPDVVARHELPITLLERGRANVLELALWRGPVLSPPAAATVTLTAASGAVLVAAGAASIVEGVARYTVASGVTTGQDLGDGWLVSWEADGRTYDHTAALCRRVPYPVITDLDVYQIAPYLDPSTPSPVTREPTLERYRTGAWIEIQHRLLQSGRRPWLIVDAAALREPHLMLTLAIVHDALGARGRSGEGMVETAARYRARYERAMGAMSIQYDDDDDGTPNRTRSQTGALWLGEEPAGSRRLRRRR